MVRNCLEKEKYKIKTPNVKYNLHMTYGVVRPMNKIMKDI